MKTGVIGSFDFMFGFLKDYSASVGFKERLYFLTRWNPRVNLKFNYLKKAYLNFSGLNFHFLHQEGIDAQLTNLATSSPAIIAKGSFTKY